MKALLLHLLHFAISCGIVCCIVAVAGRHAKVALYVLGALLVLYIGLTTTVRRQLPSGQWVQVYRGPWARRTP